MNGFRPLRNDFVSASDQNTAKFTSKKIRCFGRKVHGKLRLRGRIRSSSQSIKYEEIYGTYFDIMTLSVRGNFSISSKYRTKLTRVQSFILPDCDVDECVIFSDLDVGDLALSALQIL